MVSSNNNECTRNCWGIAALVGIVAMVLLYWLNDFGFFKAFFSGCLLAVLLGLLLIFFVCRDETDTVDQPSGDNTASPQSTQNSMAATSTTARTTDHGKGTSADGSAKPEMESNAVAQDKASDATGAFEMKTSKPLAGEKELAERKGEWKYEGKAAEAESPQTAKGKATSEEAGAKPQSESKAVAENKSPDTADAAVETASAAAIEMKASKPLAGEKELAERKGEWKYEGKAAVAESDAEAAPEAKLETKPKAKAKPAAEKPAAAAKKPAAKKTTAKKAPAKAASSADAKPAALLDGPRPEGKDDLKLISGVGPKLEETLNELGVYHFDQVAKFKKKDIEWVDARLRFKGRIERDDWMSQAKILAKGGETEFSKKKTKS